MSGSDVRLGGDFHAEKSCEAGTDCAHNEGKRDETIAFRVVATAPVKQGGNGNYKNQEDPVFGFKECHGTFLNACGNLCHLIRSFGSLVDLIGFPPSE